MLRLEELLQGFQYGGAALPYVSLGKNEPDAPEFLAGYFVSDRFLTQTLSGPACNLSGTRVQVIAFSPSQRRAADIGTKVRELLESGTFERVGNASVITRGKRIGFTRDYIYRW